jgi:hypothetical protein
VNGSVRQRGANTYLDWAERRIIMNYDNTYRQGIKFGTGTREMTLFSTTGDSGGSIIFKTRAGGGSSDTDYGTERMRITGGGNVGIGTVSPSSRFVSYGGGLWDGSDHTSKVCATLQVGRGSGTGNPVQDSGTGAILEFRHHGDYRYVTMESVSEANYSSHIGLRFKTMDDGVAPEERMRIDAHGNVGIGTASPGAKLDVNGDLTVSGKIYNYNYTEVDINAPDVVSGTWTTQTSSSWGDPKFNHTYDRYRYNDAPGYVEYTIPTGMKSAYISQLQWSSGGYVDVHGVQSDGGLVFLRRINTRQAVENTNQGNPDQHDGQTITFAGSGLEHYSSIRLTNKLGRFHLDGLGFTPNENEGTEGTGMVHSAQISDLGSGIPTPTGTGASGTWGISISGNASTATTATNQSGGTVTCTSGTFSGTFAASTASSRDKFRVYPSSSYCIGMQSGVTYGDLNDWSMTFQMNNENDRGFWWGDNGHGVNQGAMALSTRGWLNVAERIKVGGGQTDTGAASHPLHVVGQVYASGAFYTDGNRSVIRGGSPTLYFRDTDHNSAMIHNNANLLYVLRGGNDTESWSKVNNQWPWIFNLTNNDSTCGGSLYCVGNVTAYSDIRHKKDIVKLDNALEKVEKLNGYTYTRINDGKRYTGLIAQEVLEVLPEAVIADEKGDYSLAYGNMAGLFVEAMKEMKSKLDTALARLDALENPH